MLPSLQLLEKVSEEIMSVPNRRKESKREVHFCLFLLGYQSGLRVNEAVSFDLANKTKKGLYLIERPKGKKERFVYIPKKVIKELKKTNWQPNQTNHWNFYHFLKKIKRELNISKEIELSPHTLRRAFTTYQAESGLPLPLLQKLLGHKSIRTTALYWRDIYGEEDDNIGSILAGGNWLERPKPSQSKEPPNRENFPEMPKTPKPIFIDQKPVISNKNSIQQDNYLSTSKPVKKSRELINKISPNPPEKFLLDTSRENNQLETNQPLPLTANQEQKPTKREIILLQKIKYLKKQLAQLQTENISLKSENEVLAKQNNHLKSLFHQFQAKNETKSQIIQLPLLKAKN